MPSRLGVSSAALIYAYWIYFHFRCSASPLRFLYISHSRFLVVRYLRIWPSSRIAQSPLNPDPVICERVHTTSPPTPRPVRVFRRISLSIFEKRRTCGESGIGIPVLELARIVRKWSGLVVGDGATKFRRFGVLLRQTSFSSCCAFRA